MEKTVVNQVYKVIEICLSPEAMKLNVQKLIMKYQSLQIGSNSWLVVFEILCNWIKYLSPSVFEELLDNGWANIEHCCVVEGMNRIIQLGDNNLSLLISQRVKSQLNRTISNLRNLGAEVIPCDVVIRFLKSFFEMDNMNGNSYFNRKMVVKIF